MATSSRYDELVRWAGTQDALNQHCPGCYEHPGQFAEGTCIAPVPCLQSVCQLACRRSYRLAL
jgi:hypothetical protein